MSKKERTPKQRPSLEAVSPDGNCKFSRALGSVDYQTREKGLQALTLWLSKKSEVDEKDLLKLWKGIFYCFWHSDKAHVQSELADRLADIKAHLPQPMATAYFEAFIKTMRREWFGIDRIRLDKYLMLIRKFINHSLRQLQASKWKTSHVQAFSTFLQNNVMLPEDTLPAAGVSYHIADIIIPELQNIVEENNNNNNSPPSDATLKLLLAPFIKTTQLTGDPALLARLKSGFFSPLMIIAADPSQLALQQLNVEELSKVVFELGADKETKAKNRELLYEMSNALDKTSKRKQINGDTQATRDKSVKKRKLAEEEAAAAAVVAATALALKEESARKKLKKKSTPSPQSLFPNSSKPIEQQQGTEKKNKKDKAAAAATPSIDGSTGSLNNNRKKKNKDRKRPSPLSINTASTTTAIDGDMLSPSKKNVRFSLKRNLVMTIGQPPAPADVRTPPSSKPKGPALKKVSTLGQVSPPMRLDQPHHGMGLRRVSAGEVLDRPTVYGNGNGIGNGGGGMRFTIPGSSLKQRRHSHSGDGDDGDGRQQQLQQQLHSRKK